MKKIIYLLFVFVPVFLFYSCNENLDPYGEFKEEYVLNCIIRGDTTFQTATITKTYMVDNYDPYSYNEDTAVKGAKIWLWNNDSVAIMRDTTLLQSPNSNSGRPYTFYKTDSFQPEGNSLVEIEALLPNGQRLKSSAKVPAKVIMVRNNSSDRIPPEENDIVKVVWQSDQKEPVFIVRMGIYYFHEEDGKRTRKIKIVPLNYVKFNDKYVENYPKPQSEKAYGIDMATINKAMELISEGENDKSKFEILSCITEVISLNDELSLYYNATARSRDLYSVVLDESDFSSIDNGHGIFGIYMKSRFVIRFTHKYINSFGYKAGLSDVE